MKTSREWCEEQYEESSAYRHESHARNTRPELHWLLRQVGFQRVEFFACSEAGHDRG